MRRLGALLVGLGMSVAGTAPVQRSTVPALDWRPSITALASPAGAESAQPQLTTSSRGILLSWVERSGRTATLKFSERTAGGWSPPRTVASGDDWFVNWADVPSVLRLEDGTLAAHWLQKSGLDAYAYDVRLAYSTNDGRSWSAPFTPHHDGLKREHGFVSLFSMPRGGLGLVWLDGRAMASAAGHEGGASGGAMGLRYGTFDRTWKQTSEVPIDQRVCECCPTTAAMTSDGPVVAYRDRSDDEVRDIYVARLENGKWSAPKPVHHDNWQIAACPVNGPMLSARDRNVVLAWFTGKNDVGHAYVAFSEDAGRTFGPPVQLDGGAAVGRVDVALLPDGTTIATWIESANQRASFAARRVDSSGRTSPIVTISDIVGARTSGYPRVAFGGDELVFAWIESLAGKATVKTAVSKLTIKASRLQ
jgi:hypothetical protein